MGGSSCIRVKLTESTGSDPADQENEVVGRQFRPPDADEGDAVRSEFSNGIPVAVMALLKIRQVRNRAKPGQIDRVVAVIEIDNLVQTELPAEDEGIVAVSANHAIVSSATDQRIVSAAAIEKVLRSIADQLIITGQSPQNVSSTASFQDVVLGITEKLVIATGAIDIFNAAQNVGALARRLPVPPVEVHRDILVGGINRGIDAWTADQKIGAVAPDHAIVATPSAERIIAVGADQPIIPAEPDQFVVAKLAMQLVVGGVSAQRVIAEATDRVLDHRTMRDREPAHDTLHMRDEPAGMGIADLKRRRAKIDHRVTMRVAGADRVVATGVPDAFPVGAGGVPRRQRIGRPAKRGAHVGTIDELQRGDIERHWPGGIAIAQCTRIARRIAAVDIAHDRVDLLVELMVAAVPCAVDTGEDAGKAAGIVRMRKPDRVQDFMHDRGEAVSALLQVKPALVLIVEDRLQRRRRGIDPRHVGHPERSAAKRRLGDIQIKEIGRRGVARIGELDVGDIINGVECGLDRGLFALQPLRIVDVLPQHGAVEIAGRRETVGNRPAGPPPAPHDIVHEFVARASEQVRLRRHCLSLRKLPRTAFFERPGAPQLPRRVIVTVLIRYTQK